ncbi:hypothetical protein ABMA27_008317 [Loxostege sticticalis]|uniref:Uncharacterized protein n=1 Tax=Loxostege sticticalis TaxID=481309 RepID=A0ABR3HAV0_LOXSC
MLKVALTAAILALSLGGSFSSPAQDKSAKPKDDSTAKDMMMDQGDMTSGEAVKNRVDLNEIMNQCNDSFRTEMAYIEALNESGSFPDETDRTPKYLQCYVRCVLEHSGVASEDGVFDAARAAEVFAGERGGRTMTDLQDLAAACADRKETCKCDRSYRFLKCLIEAEIKEYESN